MQEISLLGVTLQLLPEKAIYIESLNSLLVADVHLGKSETFQRFGVPISSEINQQNLERLRSLCSQFQPSQLIILGDLFHSKFALSDSVLEVWFQFLNAIDASVQLIIGNHDRHLKETLEHLSIQCFTETVKLDSLLLSHEPAPQKGYLNLCGHVHPCIRIKTRLDDLRLPCFFVDRTQNLLILPSFGEFTGGYEMQLKPQSTAYLVAENSVIPFKR